MCGSMHPAYHAAARDVTRQVDPFGRSPRTSHMTTHLPVLVACAVIALSATAPSAHAEPVAVDDAALAEGNLLLALEQPLWELLSVMAAVETPAADAWTPETALETNLQLALVAATSLGPLELATQLVWHSADAPEVVFGVGGAAGIAELTTELAWSDGAWTATPGVWLSNDDGHAAGLRVELAMAGDAPPVALLSYSWRP